MVISDAHTGLVEAVGPTLLAAAWQRCRTHYLRNLVTKMPRLAQPLAGCRSSVRLVLGRCDV